MNSENRFRFASRVSICVMLTMLWASSAAAEWKEKVLHSFQGGADEGSVPAGGVVFDKQGNIYGVTSDGGGVYRLIPPAKQDGGGLAQPFVLTLLRGCPALVPPLFGGTGRGFCAGING